MTQMNLSGTIRWLLFVFLLENCITGEKALVENWSLAKPEHYSFITISSVNWERLNQNEEIKKIPSVLFLGKKGEAVQLYASREWMAAIDSLSISFIKQEKTFAFHEIDIGYKERYQHGFKNLYDIKSGYKDYRLNEMYLRGIQKKFPHWAKLEVIGNSRLGRPLVALQITDMSVPNYEKIPILCNASHHANELITVEHIYDIIYFLLRDVDRNRKLLRSFNFWFVPIVNPDGNAFFWEQSVFMGRKNGFRAALQSEYAATRGVDLNRNYPVEWGRENEKYSSSNPDSPYFRGNVPASEPETRAMMALAERERFLYSLSYHSQANSILYPYTIGSLHNPRPYDVRRIARRLADKVKSYRKDKSFRARQNLYPVDGTDQDYYYFMYGTNALLVEVSHIVPEYRLVEEILVGFRPMWQELLRTALQAPKISLRITNSLGEPLEAEVELLDIQYFNGETRTTHRNGYFFHTVSSGKNFKVAIRKKDYKDVLIALKPSRKVKPIHLVMEKEK